MSYNNRHDDQLPKVFSRLGRVTPPRQPGHNSGRYYNSQQSNDVGFRIARPHHLSNQQTNSSHYNNDSNMANKIKFQPHSTNFYSGYSRAQESIQQQRPYFPNGHTNTSINTMNNTDFRPDSSASAPTPPTPPLPSAPSGSTGNKNSFSFVKNVHKDPAASDMIISFVRNDNNSGAGPPYSYHNQDQTKDQTILHSPPSSTAPSPSISNHSDHVMIDYHSSSRRNDDDEQDESRYPSHRDIIAKSIQITASRPLGSDKNGIIATNPSKSHRHDNTIIISDDEQQQTHLSDHHEVRTVAVNRKVIVEKRDRSHDNPMTSSHKRVRLTSRSISPSPIRDKRRRSLSHESNDYSDRKHSRRVSDNEDDDRIRRRRSPSPISPPRRSRYHSRQDSMGSNISDSRRRTSLSPFNERRSLSPGSSSDEDKAPFLRHEPDRYIPDYNRRPLPPQFRRRISNDMSVDPLVTPIRSASVVKSTPVAKSAPVAKASQVMPKPTPAAAKSTPVVSKATPVAAKPAPVPVKPSVTAAAPPSTSSASSSTSKNNPIVPVPSSTEKRKESTSSLGTSTPTTPKTSVTPAKQLRNFPPLGTTSSPAPVIKELRNFPPLSPSAHKSTRPLPIVTAPATKELRSFPPLGHHKPQDLRSYPPLGSNVSSTASNPHARSPYPPSPSAAASSSGRSYNRVWMKPTNDIGTNSQQEGSNATIRKQVQQPPSPPAAVITKPPPPPPPIANQQIKINDNDALMMAQVKQEPIADATTTKKSVAAAAAAAAAVQTKTPVSSNNQTTSTVFSPVVPNDQIASSNPTTKQATSLALPPPPPPSTPSPAAIRAQNRAQSNDTVTISTSVATSPTATATVQEQSVITQPQASDSTQQVTVSTQAEPVLSKSARKRRARKQRLLEQSQMLAIEERDDVVVDVVPAPPQQSPVEEQASKEVAALNNANTIIVSHQAEPVVQNANVNQATSLGVVNTSHGTSTTHQIVQNQLHLATNSMNEAVSGQQQQGAVIIQAPVTAPVLDASSSVTDVTAVATAAATAPDALPPPPPPSSARPARRRLPRPWKVKMSDAGEIYYHNPLTGEDTWKRPE
jgi:hypothetical protein